MNHTFPDNRVKELSCRLEFDETFQGAEEEMARSMGRAIADKLVEFNKVERVPLGNGKVLFRATLFVVVPETPERNRRG